MLDGEVGDGPAFRAGLARGRGATDLLTALFEVRAAVLLGTLPSEDAAARASGLLIGADVGDRVGGQAVYLLAEGPLRDLYAAAIGDAGGQTIAVDSHRAFVAGIHQLRGLIR
jgi:2-dehydro-3-deoxygalactonokinase